MISPNERLREIMTLIDGTISLTDDKRELILLAYAMAHRSKDLLDRSVGPDQRKLLMRELTL
jgi:hypothetical protein